MRRPFLLILAALLPIAARAAPARITEPEVRAFVARQSKAWNAGDLAAYFGLYAAGATFTDQGRAKDGRTALYGTSTLSEARAQARRSLRGATVRETTTVRAVQIAPDGRSAVVISAEDTVIAKAGRTRHTCAERSQTLVATPAGLRSRGQTDTVVFCRSPAPA
jgi:uncharacterized protein (TIGR02246 family)